MGTVCSGLVSSSDDFVDLLQLSLKNQWDDYIDDDILQLSLKNQWDDYNDDDSENDNDDDGAELLSVAQECHGSDRVLSILRKNPALIHIGDPVGDTVLHLVARAGHLETVCNLIEFLDKQEDLELKYKMLGGQNGDEDTALCLLLKNGHVEVVRQLSEVDKCVVMIHYNDGITPYLADDDETGDMNYTVHIPPCPVADVEMGVIRNDLVRVSVSDHWTKLYQAIKRGQENVLITGLNKHSKELLMQQDPAGNNLLHAAVTSPGMEQLRQLVEFMTINGLTGAAFLRNIYGHTALDEATEGEQWSKAACLIKVAPRTVYQVNYIGISPLYIAVERGHQDIVKLMLSQSCLVGCASEILEHPKHSTLAHLAIKVRSFGTLMDHLPNLVDEKDEKGWRPLSYAAYSGYLEEVIYFLSKFPKSPKKYDKDGSLPIHKAIGGGHVSIIQAFISHYPKSLYHVTKKEQSVLHIAARYAGNANKANLLAYLRKEMKSDEEFTSLRDHDGKIYMDYV